MRDTPSPSPRVGEGGGLWHVEEHDLGGVLAFEGDLFFF